MSTTMAEDAEVYVAPNQAAATASARTRTMPVGIPAANTYTRTMSYRPRITINRRRRHVHDNQHRDNDDDADKTVDIFTKDPYWVRPIGVDTSEQTRLYQNDDDDDDDDDEKSETESQVEAETRQRLAEIAARQARAFAQIRKHHMRGNGGRIGSRDSKHASALWFQSHSRPEPVTAAVAAREDEEEEKGESDAEVVQDHAEAPVAEIDATLERALLKFQKLFNRSNTRNALSSNNLERASAPVLGVQTRDDPVVGVDEPSASVETTLDAKKQYIVAKSERQRHANEARRVEKEEQSRQTAVDALAAALIHVPATFFDALT